ncbi:MAG: fasciclin domain-containing protein [Lewinellaceae bacterium]|nr:fasciclin domain-containing protein [Lewinellaceae bacterium]
MKLFYLFPFLLFGVMGYSQFNLPVDFQSSTITYVLTDFGGNTSLVVSDPTDVSNNVAQSTKTSTAELWAGTTMGTDDGFDSPIPFSTIQTKMTVRVWSPDAGIPVRLKVEDSADPGKSVETEANTTVAMAWETLEFDFANEVPGTAPLNLANSYDKASIFFNFGTTGADAGEKTYYWDDVELVPAPDSTVVDIIVNSPDHETLETAVIAAGLDDDLSGFGPFTVFAPTDAAFAALPAGALDALLADPTGALAEVLLYHVLGAEVLSTSLTDGQMAATLQGADITVTIDGGNVFINNAMVTVADLQADNGVVHVIDAVLLPPAQIDLPITFDDPNVDYNLADFGGNASSIVVDPTDPSNMVGQAIRTADALIFAGTTMGADGLANPIPFTASQTQMTVRVWSPEAGIPVRLKVEDATNPAISVETEVNTSVAMEWDTLTFNFNNEVPGTAPINLANTYDKASIFFNFGAEGAVVGEQTYYWDDVELVPLPDSTVVDIIVNSPDHETLETAVIAAGLDDDLSGVGPFTVFAPTDAAFAALPAGALDALLADPTGALAEVLLYHVLGAEVLSSSLTDGQIAATLQGADITVTIDGGNVFINDAMVTVADLRADNGVVHVIDAVLLPPAQIDLPITFDDPNVDYNLADFGGNASSIVVDPTDASNMVGQAIRTADALVFAGTTMGADGLANPIPFTANQTQMTVRVWSPEAGIPVRLKVEDATNPAISVETEVNTSVAMEWETLTFNFSNEVPGTAPINLANTYDKISIFFNFGAEGAVVGEQTYYWDDVELAPAPDFTVVDIIVNSPDHETLETAVIAAGLDDDLSGAGPFTVFAPTDAAFAALPAGALDALLADPTGALAEVLLYHVLGAEVLSSSLTDGQMATTLQGADITVTIDGGNVFINDAMVTVADLQADNGVVHVIDAVLLPPAQIDLPITFDDPNVDYNLADFGGNASSIVVDPTDPSNMVGQAVKTATAELWAGTTMGGDGLANPVPFADGDTKMTVRVWSPDAGIPIRLKAEDATNPAISVETEATTTVAMAWETLEFDFSNEAMGTAPIDFANTYDKISIFFNFGTTGADAGEKTYYWDDVEFGAKVTVVDIVVNSPDHETLETAVIAAELDDDLSGAGPFTVFAPTDDAFAALPAGTLDALLADPTGILAQILLYHVLGAEVYSTDLTDGQMATTLQGEDITVTINGDGVFINDAMVTVADIPADNGVVHVIDAVLLPPSINGTGFLPAAANGIQVSPNPANSYVNIEFAEALRSAVQLTLYDATGKVLKQEQIRDQVSQVNTSGLKPGAYFLRFDSDSASYYQKVMIAR